MEKNTRQGPLEPSGPEEKAAQQGIRLLGALMANGTLKDDPPFLQQAIEAIAVHIVPSIQHASPVLRSAALTEIGGASKELLTALPQSVIEQLMHDALTAAMKDPIPAVRSSACKMIGDLVNAGFYLSNKVLIPTAWSDS